jgi:hypothetical protein
MANLALQGRVGRAGLGRHTDDLIAGLALGAGEILGDTGKALS